MSRCAHTRTEVSAMPAITREPPVVNILRHLSVPVEFILPVSRVWLTACLVSGTFKLYRTK
jgi:hypothetical protein